MSTNAKDIAAAIYVFLLTPILVNYGEPVITSIAVAGALLVIVLRINDRSEE